MITVSQLNEKIKAILEATFMHIVVEGEVASATYHSSGHLYFTIKDDKSSIKCVMWRSNVRKMKFKIEPGEHIVIDGSIGVYSPRGEYQLIAVNIEPFGKGALALAYEQLKKKLEAKGYFDKSRKKPIPKFIKKVAIVTSLKGAALQDMIKVATKRWPLIEIVAIDALVQGEMASREIAKAIEFANSLDVDVVVVGRGGGSQEDLWAFNEEIVADAIFNSKIPIVSAVGHEVDVLISDFVADLRAPTPSAAMEMILPDINEMLYMLDDLRVNFEQTINIKLEQNRQKIDYLYKRLISLSPKERLNFYKMEFDRLELNLNRYIKNRLNILFEQIEPIKRGLKDNIDLVFRKKQNSLVALEELINLHNPKNRIKDGFVEVVKNRKRVDICKINVDDKLELVNNKCKVEVKVIKNPSRF